MTDSREQLERLLSERLDGTLTSDELAAVDRLLASDPTAAAVARQYERLAAVLRNWRSPAQGIDWRAYARRLSDHVSEDAGAQASALVDEAIDPSISAADQPVAPHIEELQREYGAVDALVRDGAAPMPEVNWEQFQARVSAAIQREAESVRRKAVWRWRKVARWTGTVLAPLAAAAVIAIVVWWPRGDLPKIAPKGRIAGSIVLVALDAPAASGRVSVAFDETPAAEAAAGVPSEPPQEGTVIAIGESSAASADAGDEALYY